MRTLGGAASGTIDAALTYWRKATSADVAQYDERHLPGVVVEQRDENNLQGDAGKTYMRYARDARAIWKKTSTSTTASQTATATARMGNRLGRGADNGRRR